MSDGARLGRSLGPERPTNAPPLSYPVLATFGAYGPLLLAGLFLIVTYGDWRVAVAWATGLCLLFAAVPAVLWRARQARLGLHEFGIRVRRWGRTRTLLLDDVERVSLRERNLVQNGIIKGVRRRLDLVAGGLKTRLWDVETEGRREVAEIFGQLLNRMADVVENRLKVGHAWAGRAWSLDAAGIQDGAHRIPLDSLTKVAHVRGQLCVWTDGVAPRLSIPLGSANACVLSLVLGRRLAGRTASTTLDEPLGRLLFVSRPDLAVPLFCVAVGFAGLAQGVARLVRGTVDLETAVGLAFGYLAWSFLPDLVTRLRIHENGVARRGYLGWRSVAYPEIDHFSFVDVRTTSHGYYTGTNLHFEFRREGDRAISFDYRSTQGGESELLELRDRVARAVAERMRIRLKRQGSVSWTSAAQLTPWGVVPARPPGAAPLSFLDVASWRVEAGVFKLFREGQRSVLELRADEEDFYPGLLLFEDLVAKARETPEPSRR